jgi:hypothetical protein
MRTLFFTAVRTVRQRAGVGEGVTGFSVAPEIVEESEGLPGAWAVLFLRAVVQDPARCESLLAHLTETTAIAFRQCESLGTRNVPLFEAKLTAHTLAYLRIASRVTATGARLATGSGGLTLGRAGFAPAGRQTKFHGDIASLHSPSTSLACSHHFRWSATPG